MRSYASILSGWVWCFMSGGIRAILRYIKLLHWGLNNVIIHTCAQRTLRVLSVVLLCFFIGEAWANPPTLQFSISNQVTQSFTLDQLKSKLDIHEITFRDPHYAKIKRYSAFLVSDVLRLAYGKEWEKDIYTDVTFTALDGYKAIGHISKLKEKGGYLAYLDLDIEGWEPIGRKKSIPGPFYLVWTGKLQTTEYEYPWPWQLASINIVRFEDQYPAVYPQGVKTDSSIYKGFQIFKYRCFRCHSINQQGGKIGPDLNAPQSIVEYRSRKMIKEFIKHPSKYRHTQMPDHLDFSEQDLDMLLDYFWYKSKAN